MGGERYPASERSAPNKASGTGVKRSHWVKASIRRDPPIRSGAAVARWAHNPKVPGANPGSVSFAKVPGSNPGVRGDEPWRGAGWQRVARRVSGHREHDAQTGDAGDVAQLAERRYAKRFSEEGACFDESEVRGSSPLVSSRKGLCWLYAKASYSKIVRKLESSSIGWAPVHKCRVDCRFDSCLSNDPVPGMTPFGRNQSRP